MEKNQPTEYETIQLRIPKNIMRLLSDFLETPVNEYLEHCIIESVRADLDAGELISSSKVKEKYELQEILS